MKICNLGSFGTADKQILQINLSENVLKSIRTTKTK